MSAAAVLGRARADAWPLLLSATVVALTALLATITPRLADSTADSTVRTAVATAGADAELRASEVFTENPFEARDLHPALAETVADRAAALEGSLPPRLAEVLDAPVGTGKTLALYSGPQGDVPDPALRLVHLWRGGRPDVTWVTGGPARATITGDDVRAGIEGPWPIQAGLAEDVAEALHLDVGDHWLLVNASKDVEVDVEVSGIFRPADPADPVWAGAAGILAPRVVGSSLTNSTQVAALLSDDSLPVAVLAMPPGTTQETITLRPVPDRFDRESPATVGPEVAAVKVAAEQSSTGYGEPTARVVTRLDAVLAAVDGRIAAARAQTAALLAAVLSAAGLATLLAARLLVRRRSDVLATYRHRGGSLPGVAAELAAESVLLALLGTGAGVLAASVIPGPVPWAWVVPVAALAAAGPVVLGVIAAARVTGGRRAAANRQDRRVLDRDRRAARIALDVALALLAVGALAALTTRGIVGNGVDLLLTLAPTCAAVAGGALLLRTLEPLLRLGQHRALRSRRLGPALAAARARTTGRDALPFVALTATVCLAALAGAVVATVESGEQAASWTSVGADAVVRTAPDPAIADVATVVAGAPGVVGAVPVRTAEGAELFGGWGGRVVRVVALRAAEYRSMLRDTPLRDDPGIHALADAAAGDRPAVLVTDDLSSSSKPLSLLWDGGRVDVVAVGRAPERIAGTQATIVVDLDAISAAGVPVVPDELWAVGPGAAAAVADEPVLAGAAVVTRDGWLAAHRADPLTAGVVRLAASAALLLVVLAALVVVLGATTSAPARGRTLATVRTLGVDGRSARWISLGEQLPALLLATLGGTAAGVLLARAVMRPLALRLVTGQMSDPGAVVPWWVGAPALAILVTALAVVAVESSLRRRERLGEVLRVGG